MRQFVITLVALLSFVPETRAQSFMQHLQQDVKGKGTVTVTQSKDIDELVDKADVSGHKTATAKPAQPGKTATGSNSATTQQHKADKTSAATSEKKDHAPHKENNIS